MKITGYESTRHYCTRLLKRARLTRCVFFGPIYQQAKLSSDTIDNFGEVFPDLSEDNVSRKHYLGLNTQFRYNPFSTDSLPIFQARFLVNTGYLKQLEENTVNFGFIRGYVSLFLHIYDSRKMKGWY